jgi:hypothetical protein
MEFSFAALPEVRQARPAKCLPASGVSRRKLGAHSNSRRLRFQE